MQEIQCKKIYNVKIPFGDRRQTTTMAGHCTSGWMPVPKIQARGPSILEYHREWAELTCYRGTGTSALQTRNCESKSVLAQCHVSTVLSPWVGHGAWGGPRTKDICGEAVLGQFQALHACYGKNLECSPDAHVLKSHSL